MKTDLLNMFNRFANYLEKNNSSIRIKIENDDIMFIDDVYSFDNKYVYNTDIRYIKWFVIFEKIPLETQIEYFFFGKHCESAKNFTIPVMISIFEYCNNFLIDTYLMLPFGLPRTFEELAMKMDLIGI